MSIMSLLALHRPQLLGMTDLVIRRFNHTDKKTAANAVLDPYDLVIHVLRNREQI